MSTLLATMLLLDEVEVTKAGDWDESKHPRGRGDEGGQFVSGGGGGATAGGKKPSAATPAARPAYESLPYGSPERMAAYAEWEKTQPKKETPPAPPPFKPKAPAPSKPAKPSKERPKGVVEPKTLTQLGSAAAWAARAQYEDEVDPSKYDDMAQEEKFQALLEAQSPELSEDQVEAIGYYTQGGDQDFNGYLRGQSSELRNKKELKILRTAVNKNVVPEGTVLYRGARFKDEAMIAKLMTPGATFSDKGFVSTSSDIGFAAHFALGNAEQREEATPVIFQHVSEKGQKGLVISEDNSGYNQREVLLAEGSNFEVVDAKKVNNKHYKGLVVRIKRKA